MRNQQRSRNVILLDMRREGHTLDEISDCVGVSGSRVRQLLRVGGIRLEGWRTTANGDRNDEMYATFKSGAGTVEEIAEAHGLTSEYVKALFGDYMAMDAAKKYISDRDGHSSEAVSVPNGSSDWEIVEVPDAAPELPGVLDVLSKAFSATVPDGKLVIAQHYQFRVGYLSALVDLGVPGAKELGESVTVAIAARRQVLVKLRPA